MDYTGKIVRLHSKSQPSRYKLYMVMGEYDGYANGTVTNKTVNEWIASDRLDVTVYGDQCEQCGKNLRN